MLEAYCNAQEWKGELRLFYVDAATTSKIPFVERTAGKALNDALQPGDRVVFTKLDRGFRNTREFLETMERWERLHISVYIINFMGGNAIDFASPIGKFCLTVLAASAELERSQIAERTREGLRHAKKSGVMLGGRPRYGFKYEWFKVDGKRRRRQVRDDEERRQMKEIVKLRAEDPQWSWDEIREHLNYTLKWYRVPKWKAVKNREWSIGAIFRACRAELVLQYREMKGQMGNCTRSRSGESS